MDAQAGATRSSYQVFMGFVKRDPVTGQVDASGVIERPCFEAWMDSRRKPPKNPPRAFKDSLKTTLTASNRCKPFPPDVEAALLKLLRQERVWPCFVGRNESNIGQRGWKVPGYHEQQRETKQEQADERERPEATEQKEPETESPVLEALQAPPVYSNNDLAPLELTACEPPSPSPSPSPSSSSPPPPPPPLPEVRDEAPIEEGDAEPEWVRRAAGKRRSRGLEDFLEPPCRSVSKAPRALEVPSSPHNQPRDSVPDSREASGPDTDASALVTAYNVFESLCEFPAGGFNYHFPVLQTLLEPSVARRFHALYLVRDPRLDEAFICPRHCAFKEDAPVLRASMDYAMDGTPFICVEREEAVVDMLGYEVLGKPMLCSECPLYDAWIMHIYKSTGTEARFAAGEPTWAHTIVQTTTGKRVLRTLARVVGTNAAGGVRIECELQDLSEQFADVLGLPDMF